MTLQRKSSAIREKELRLAIGRIEHGRSKFNIKSLSISSVAKEAGVSPALIHNHYPDIAILIRQKLSAKSVDSRSQNLLALKTAQAVNKELRLELKELVQQKAKLASINEMLMVEIHLLKALNSNGNVKKIRR